MKKLLLGLAALPFMASMAMAGQPSSLSDTQLDKVTAGQIVQIQVTTAGITWDYADASAPTGAALCVNCANGGPSYPPGAPFPAVSIAFSQGPTLPPVSTAIP